MKIKHYFLSLIILLVFNTKSQAETSAAVKLRRALRIDSDRDGLPDIVEKAIGTNPKKADSDNDGILDSDETDSVTNRSLEKSYKSGQYDSEIDNEDNDDGESNTKIPKAKPIIPVCTKSNQKNCKLPVCKKSRQKNCRPKNQKPSGGSTTPTPVPSSGNFDSNGNTSKFGIPAGLTGNIDQGMSIWAGTCRNCHSSEPTGRSFSTVRSALNLSAMRSLGISNQQAADLTAYLNRLSR